MKIAAVTPIVDVSWILLHMMIFLKLDKWFCRKGGGKYLAPLSINIRDLSWSEYNEFVLDSDLFLNPRAKYTSPVGEKTSIIQITLFCTMLTIQSATQLPMFQKRLKFLVI